MTAHMVQIVAGRRLQSADHDAAQTVLISTEVKAVSVPRTMQDRTVLRSETGSFEPLQRALELVLGAEDADDEPARVWKAIEGWLLAHRHSDHDTALSDSDARSLEEQSRSTESSDCGGGAQDDVASDSIRPYGG
ncbi:MAG: hypothetical protein LC777_00830 [Actinobacteria bacterium]|nr:hypothetical protein [Actinomycetota bacterium]